MRYPLIAAVILVFAASGCQKKETATPPTGITQNATVKQPQAIEQQQTPTLDVESKPAPNEPPKAKLGDPDSMQALNTKIIANCKKMVKNTKGNEVKEMIERDGELVLPVTPNFISIEFKHKENVLYCYSAKAGDYKTFKPIKLVYFTNYAPYGFYDPAKGLKVKF